MSLMDVAEPGRTLGEVARVLRPGGFVQFSVLHPVISAPIGRWVDDESGVRHARVAGGYFYQGPLTGTWTFNAAPAEVRDRYQPFTITYARALAGAGQRWDPGWRTWAGVTTRDSWPAPPGAACGAGCQDGGVEVLSGRILVRPAGPGRSRHFYRDLLGLAICREFGPPEDPGVVFFLGQGLLEVSGHSAGPAGDSVVIWLQVRDVHAEHERLAAAGVRIVREPAAEPWGLTEMWIEDPDGIRIVLVEVPPRHPLRRDPRSPSPPR